MEQLKGCPHCGGHALLNSNYSYKARSYFVFVRCEICGAQGKIYNSDTDPAATNWDDPQCRAAAAAWNMRTNEQQQDSERGRRT